MSAAVVSGWRAHLDLGFELRRANGHARTVPIRRRHRGPLMVQRPLYPEGAVCHSLILHPPGGMVGGDSLELDVSCGPGAQALLTTPGAGKCYRSAGAQVRVRQRLRVDPGGGLEWLPQELIVYEGAVLEAVTRVELARDARFLGWEIVCLGRPASGEGFGRGRFTQRFEIRRAGAPLLVERLSVPGGDVLLEEPWGLGGSKVSAILVATPADAALRDAVLDAAGADPGFSATLLDDLLVSRYLGTHGGDARACLEAAWGAIRKPLFGREARRPRIWNT